MKLITFLSKFSTYIILQFLLIQSISGQKLYNSQPELDVRSVKIIELDGLKFKDLNINGKLDIYEDWQRPIEERIKDGELKFLPGNFLNGLVP
jgi:hypothetical protein